MRQLLVLKRPSSLIYTLNRTLTCQATNRILHHWTSIKTKTTLTGISIFRDTQRQTSTLPDLFQRRTCHPPADSTSNIPKTGEERKTSQECLKMRMGQVQAGSEPARPARAAVIMVSVRMGTEAEITPAITVGTLTVTPSREGAQQHQIDQFRPRFSEWMRGTICYER